MGKINVGRMILGGIAAGIVGDILGFGVDGWMLAQRWSDAMRALGHSDFSSTTLIWFNVIGLAVGIVSIWIYVAIRPRFGPGIKTAIYAGVVTWILATLLPNAGFMYAAGLFPRHLTLYTTLGGIVEVTVATIIGAALYKEE
jgi:hypothetical protein